MKKEVKLFSIFDGIFLIIQIAIIGGIILLCISKVIQDKMRK